MPKQGLHLITPTSATVTGGGSQTATINANGSITFSAVYGLKLAGVFSNTYDNYQIVCRTTRTGGNTSVYMWMLSGTTRDTTNNGYQTIQANDTVISSSRATAQTEILLGRINTTLPHGFVNFVYSPYLAQPTVGRTLAIDSASSALIYETAWSHNVSSSFDGVELWFNNNTGQSSAGLVSIYGMRK